MSSFFRYLAIGLVFVHGFGSFVASGFWIWSIADRGFFDERTLLYWALSLSMWAYAADRARHAGLEHALGDAEETK